MEEFLPAAKTRYQMPFYKNKDCRLTLWDESHSEDTPKVLKIKTRICLEGR